MRPALFNCVNNNASPTLSKREKIALCWLNAGPLYMTLVHAVNKSLDVSSLLGYTGKFYSVDGTCSIFQRR